MTLLPMLPQIRRTVLRRRARYPEELLSLEPEAAPPEAAPPDKTKPSRVKVQRVERVERYPDGWEEVLATLRDRPLLGGGVPIGDSQFSPRVVAQPFDLGGVLDQMMAGYQSGLETRPPATEVATKESEAEDDDEDETDEADPATAAVSPEGTKTSPRVKVKVKHVGPKRVRVKNRNYPAY